VVDSVVKLSICMATYNRGSFIAETLDSILMQMTDEVELVVVDGASPDNTQDVMAEYMKKYPAIKYYREEENSGVDQDYDKAVGYAKGDYCWLMPDDDLLYPNAIARVLKAIGNDVDLVVVNADVRDADVNMLLNPSRLNFYEDKVYGKGDKERLYIDVADHLSFIGGTVVKKGYWLSRDRVSYYGSLFIHMGVLFQTPAVERAYVIAEPLIKIRYGNAMWSPRGFEIWMFIWPQLVWDFPDFSDEAKQQICDFEPWRKFKNILSYRATGSYTLAEYRRLSTEEVNVFYKFLMWITAVSPVAIVNFLAVIFHLIKKGENKMGLYSAVRSNQATLTRRVLALFIKRKGL